LTNDSPFSGREAVEGIGYSFNCTSHPSGLGSFGLFGPMEINPKIFAKGDFK
jgi:hypothetical protein